MRLLNHGLLSLAGQQNVISSKTLIGQKAIVFEELYGVLHKSNSSLQESLLEREGLERVNTN